MPPNCPTRGVHLNLLQMQGHRDAVAPRQHESGASPPCGADGTEDIRRCGALITRCRWSRAAPRPAPRDLVLLAILASSANHASMGLPAASRAAIFARRCLAFF